MEDKHIFSEGPFPTLVYVVTTIYKDVVNACPVTWCTPCSYNPPLFMVSIKKGKDTAFNILQNHEFVLQTVSFKHFQEVHNLAKTLERDVSELVIDDLRTVDTLFTGIPRLDIAINWYECKTSLGMINNYGKTHFQVTGEVLSSGYNYQQQDPLLYHGQRLYSGSCKILEAEPY